MSFLQITPSPAGYPWVQALPLLLLRLLGGGVAAMSLHAAGIIPKWLIGPVAAALVCEMLYVWPPVRNPVAPGHPLSRRLVIGVGLGLLSGVAIGLMTWR